MNSNAHRFVVLVAITLGIAFAGYAAALMSGFGTGPKPDSERVMYLGTIIVTPQDTPGRAERYALRARHHRVDTVEQTRRAS